MRKFYSTLLFSIVLILSLSAFSLALAQSGGTNAPTISLTYYDSQNQPTYTVNTCEATKVKIVVSASAGNSSLPNQFNVSLDFNSIITSAGAPPTSSSGLSLVTISNSQLPSTCSNASPISCISYYTGGQTSTNSCISTNTPVATNKIEFNYNNTTSSQLTQVEFEFYIDISCQFADGNLFAQGTNIKINSSCTLSNQGTASTIASANTQITLAYPELDLSLSTNISSTQSLKIGDIVKHTITIQNTGNKNWDPSQTLNITHNIINNITIPGNIFNINTITITQNSNSWTIAQQSITNQQINIIVQNSSTHPISPILANGAGNNIVIELELQVTNLYCGVLLQSQVNVNYACVSNINCQSLQSNVIKEQFKNEIDDLEFTCQLNTQSYCLNQWPSITNPNPNTSTSNSTPFNATLINTPKTKNYQFTLSNFGNGNPSNVRIYFYKNRNSDGYTYINTSYNMLGAIGTANLIQNPSTDPIANQIITNVGHSNIDIYQVNLSPNLLDNTSVGSPKSITFNFETITIQPDLTNCTPKIDNDIFVLVVYDNPCTGVNTFMASGEADKKSLTANYLTPRFEEKLIGTINYYGPTLLAGNDQYDAQGICENKGNYKRTMTFTLPNSTPKVWPASTNASFKIELELSECINLFMHEYDPNQPAGFYDADILNRIRLYNHFGIAYGSPGFGANVTAHYKNIPGQPVNTTSDIIELTFDNITIPTSSTDHNVIPENILKGLVIEADVQAHCCCADGTGNFVNMSVYHVLDNTCPNESKIKLGCFSKIIVVTCPGCRRKGVHTTSCSLMRLNYGYQDTDNDNFADAVLNNGNYVAALTSPTISPRILTKRCIPNDTLQMKQECKVELSNYGPLQSIAQCSTCINPQDLVQLNSNGEIQGFKYGYIRTIIKNGLQNNIPKLQLLGGNIKVIISNAGALNGTYFIPASINTYPTSNTLEFYADFSINALNLPSTSYFPDGARIDIEETFKIVYNPSSYLEDYNIVNRAYFGLKAEVGNNPSTWLVDPDFKGTWSGSINPKPSYSDFHKESDYDDFCTALNSNSGLILKEYDTYDYIQNENSSLLNLCDIAFYCNDDNVQDFQIASIKFIPFERVYVPESNSDQVACTRNFKLDGDSHGNNDIREGYFRIGDGTEMFPYEYRNLNKLESISITGLPAATSVVLSNINSNTTFATGFPVQQLATNIPFQASSNPNYNCNLDLNTLYAIINPNTNQIKLPEESNFWNLRGDVNIPCNIIGNATTFPISTEYAYSFKNNLISYFRGISGSAVTVNNNGDSLLTFTSTRNLKNHLPNITFSAGNIIGQNGKLSAILNFTNTDSFAIASNFFLLLHIPNNITTFSIKKIRYTSNGGNTFVTGNPTSPNIVQYINGQDIGITFPNQNITSFGPLANISIELECEYNCNANLSTIPLEYGWNCDPLLSIVDMQSACGNFNTTLIITQKDPKMMISDLTDYTQPFCSPILHRKYIIKNPYGYLQNIGVNLTVPIGSGFTVSPNSININIKKIVSSGFINYPIIVNGAALSTGTTNILLNNSLPGYPSDFLPTNQQGVQAPALPGNIGQNAPDYEIEVCYDLVLGCLTSFNQLNDIVTEFTSYNGCINLINSIANNPILLSSYNPYSILNISNNQNNIYCNKLDLNLANIIPSNDPTFDLSNYGFTISNIIAPLSINSIKFTDNTNFSNTPYTLTNIGSNYYLPSIIASNFNNGIIELNFGTPMPNVVSFDVQLFVKNACNQTLACNDILLNTIHINLTYTPITFSAVITPTYGSCLQALSDLNISNITGGLAPYTITLTDGSNNNQTISSPYTFNNLNPGTYSCIVNDAGSCSSASQTITINNRPNLSLTYSSSTSFNCFPFISTSNQINLSAAGGIPPYSFSYYTFNNINSINNIPAQINLTQAGVYTFSVQDINGCNVVLNPYTLPLPAPCGPSSICENGQATFNCLPVVGASSYNWIITNSNGSQTTGQFTFIQPINSNTVSILFNTPGNYTVQVEALDVNGVLLTSGISTLTVNPLPIADFNISTQNFCLDATGSQCWISCTSSSVNLMPLNYNTITSSTFSYNWSIIPGTINPGNSIFSSVTAANPTLNLPAYPGDFSVQLTVTDLSTGCSKTEIHCIKVIDQPQANFVFADAQSNPLIYTGVLTVCNGGSVNLLDASILAPNASNIISSYVISGNGGSLPITLSALPTNLISITLTSLGLQTITVTITTTCGCVSTYSLQVNVLPDPAPDINCPTTVCYRDIATYTTSNQNCATYNWSVTNGTIITPAPYGPSIQVDWNQAVSMGTVSLQVNNCIGYICNQTNTVNIPILSPNATIYKTPNVPPCQGNIVKYYVTNVPGTIYTWTVTSPAVIIGPNIGSSIIVRANGPNYTVNVSYSNCTLPACKGSSTYNETVGKTFAIQCANSTAPCDAACISSTSQLSTNANGNVFNWSITQAGNSTVLYTQNASANCSINWSTILNTSTYSSPTQFIVKAHDPNGIFCNPSDPTYIITVVPTPPTPNISAITPYNCICQHAGADFTGTPVAGTFLQWDVLNNAGTPLSGTGNTFSVKLTGANPVIEVRQASQIYPYCVSQALSLPITYCTPPPVAQQTLPPICINASSTISAPQGYDDYLWLMKDAKIGTISGSQFSRTVSMDWHASTTPTNNAFPGNFTIECIGHFCGIAYSNQYVQNLIPPAPISLSGPNSACADQANTFTITGGSNSSCSISGPYDWDFGDGSTQTTTSLNNTHNYKIPGTFTVKVTAHNSSTYLLAQYASSTITINPSPIAVVSLSTGNCPNYTLQASNPSNPSGTYNYAWSFNGTPIPASNGSTISTTLGQGNYAVILSDPVNGCSASDYKTINCSSYSTGPSLTPCSGTTCTGPTLTAQVINKCQTDIDIIIGSAINTCNPAIDQFTLDYGDGTSLGGPTSSLSPGTPIQHHYQHVGNYTIRLILSASTQPNSCPIIVSTPVTLLFKQNHKVGYSCNYNNILNITVSDLSEVLYPNANYKWNSKPTTSANTFSYNPITLPSFVSNTCNYIIIDALNNQCSPPVIPLNYFAPQAAFSIPPPPYCETNPIHVTDNSTGTGLSYSWDVTSTNLINTQKYSNKTPFIFNPFPRNQNIDLTICDMNFCISQSTIPINAFQDPQIKSVLLQQTPSQPCIPNPGNLESASSSLLFANTPYKYYWLKGLAFIGSNTSSLTKITSIPFANSGAYTCLIEDVHKCIGYSTGGEIAFKQPPLANIVPVNAPFCYGNDIQLSAFAGANYSYAWSVSTSPGGSPINLGPASPLNTSTLFIRGQVLNPGTYFATVLISDASCSNSSQFVFTVLPKPNIGPISMLTSNYCPKNNMPFTLQASASGGTLNPLGGNAYSFLWSNGQQQTANPSSTMTATQPGIYSVQVTDNMGCSSNSSSFTVKDKPDFSSLISGCFSDCQPLQVCGIVNPNYPVSYWEKNGAWYANGPNATLSTGGDYTYVLCDPSMTCCFTSKPILFQLINCNNCCQNATAQVTQMNCVDPDANGNNQYSFSIAITNSCNQNMQVSFSEINGNISQLNTNLVIANGTTTITGVYTCLGGLNVANFCPVISYYTQNAATGTWQGSCDGMPNCFPLPYCQSSTPCLPYFGLASPPFCLGYQPNPNPILSYFINLNVVNPFPNNVNYILTSQEGNFQTGSGSLNPGMNNILDFFDDGINFDLYFNFTITLSDPATGAILCIQQIGTAVQPCQNASCPPDVHMNSIVCIGKDNNGHDIYVVNLDLGNVLPNANISISSPQGIVSLITPNTTGASPAAVIPVGFQVVDYANQGILCFAIQLTDINGGGFCYVDFTQDPNLCSNVVPCGNPKNTSQNPLPNKTGTSIKNNTYISVNPNPSDGKAMVKISCEGELAGYTFELIVTGTGQVAHKEKITASNSSFNLEELKLNPGHYILLLKQNNQIKNAKAFEIIQH